MTLLEIKEALDAECLTCEESLQDDVFAGISSDLMSDVLAFAKEKVVLLTGLVNTQVIRAAETMGIKAVVFVRGKSPTPDMIALARSKGLVLMNTGHPLYVAAGLLYSNGLGGLTVE